MKNSNKKIFIHIGAHKTGTTSLQDFLKNNHNKKLFIPKYFRYEDKNIINHCVLAWSIYGDERFNYYKNKTNKSQIDIENFIEEIKDKNKVFLTSEDFVLLLTNIECKQKFEELFNEFEIIYICYLRNTYDYKISLINEFLKHKKKNFLYNNFLKIRYFYYLSQYGIVKNDLYKNIYETYFIINSEELKKRLLYKSRGKFYFFCYEKKTDIAYEFFKLGVLNNLPKKEKYHNVSKKKFFSLLNLLNYIWKKNFVNPMIFNKHHEINKIINDK